MKARPFILTCIVAILFLADTSSARAEFVSIGFSSPPIPPGGFFQLTAPEEPDVIHQKILTFEGSIQNTDLHLGTAVQFWFDWISGTTPFQTAPLTFTLTPVGGGHNFEAFGGTSGNPPLSTTIPYCPEEVSIHFANLGPGGPVFAAGTFTYECQVPEPVALVIFPVMVLMAPLALRGVKKFAGAI